MSDPLTEHGLAERAQRALDRARIALAVVSRVVPRDRREEWVREWHAELWHFLAMRAPSRPFADALALTWRLTGTVPHALWLRRNEWRVEMLRQDISYAVRNMRRHPLFALLVTTTLGLGIGVNTAMFTVVNSVLIQPLPYRDADRLVFMYGATSKFDQAAISPPDFLDYRAANTAFESLGAAEFTGSATITGDGEPERVSSSRITANYFSTLGVAPIRGRAFTPAEEEGGGHDVAIISYGLWQRRFGADPRVLERAITLDGRATRIVGVMPPVLDRTLDLELWRPLQFHTPGTTIRRFHFIRAIGRLKPGVTIAQAQASMNVVAKRLEAVYPENATWHLNMMPYRDVVVGRVGKALLFLFGAVALVLLIACGNVASLLLARATARQGEIAIRTALGASKTRLVQQLLTESLMLACAGGASGFVLGALLVRTLRLIGAGILPRLAEVSIDMTVLLFTLGLSAATGLIFGLAPALHAVRHDLVHSLASLGRSSGARSTMRARDLLVVFQVALSLVLLAGAGLLFKSLWKLQHVAPGFDPRNVLTAEVSLPDRRYPDDASKLRFWQDLHDRLQSIPGVRSASFATMIPLHGAGDTRYWIEGHPQTTETQRGAQISVVGDDYFSTMSIPIVRGRALGRAERTGPNAIVISRAMADKLFPGEDAIGRRLVVDFGQPFFVGEIVGVADNVNAFGLDAPPPDIFYFSVHQSGGFGRDYMNILVRATGDPVTLLAPVRATLASLDRDIPLSGARSMLDMVDASTSRQQFATRLVVGFAAVALLLAVVGLYGVLAFIVSQRTRELGIRIALGAPSRRVFALVVGRGMKLVAAGVALGLVGALTATRLVDRLLFQVESSDPLVLGSVTLALATAAFVACVLPARQATRVDPIIALRSEA